MGKSRNSHLRKMYDLRFNFKYVLADVFFSNPKAFIDNSYNETLDKFLLNLWNEYVISEELNTESYTTQFDIEYSGSNTGDEVILFINMPDILDINNPQIEYAWHSSVGVGYILYFNFARQYVRFYICESSMSSSMNMARFNGEYIPVYFVVEFAGSERRNLDNINSHSIEEVRNIFFNAVVADIKNSSVTDNR